mmetsp:Transcript_32462/g.49660  ORF Transcript_32462/g.49660 Transcript_32462/m.49660 type:complete len:202 (+) Transcript_32462:396-1001(+)
MTNPGDDSCPQFRPLVRIEDTMTIFLMVPVALAASTSLQVPMLSTACAASFILSGLDGTNPVAMTKASAPSIALAMSPTLSSTTFNFVSCTADDDDVSTDPTRCTMAPRTTVESVERDSVAFATLRTPPIIVRLFEFAVALAAKRSNIRRPVCPVAPATTIFFVVAFVVAASSANATNGAPPKREEATAAVAATVAGLIMA